MSKREKMFSMIDEYLGSGIAMREFTHAKGIKLSTFTYWVRKRKKAERSPGNFLTVSAAPADYPGTLEIVYPNGVRIITGSESIVQLRQLVKLF